MVKFNQFPHKANVSSATQAYSSTIKKPFSFLTRVFRNKEHILTKEPLPKRIFLMLKNTSEQRQGCKEKAGNLLPHFLYLK